MQLSAGDGGCNEATRTPTRSACMGALMRVSPNHMHTYAQAENTAHSTGNSRAKQADAFLCDRNHRHYQTTGLTNGTH